MRLASTARCTCASAAPREYSTWCAAVTSNAARRGDSSSNGRFTSGVERGLQPQVPAQRAERDGAHRGAIDAFVRSLERRVGGTAFVDHFVHGERRCGQRFGARRMAAAARLWRRIAPYLHFFGTFHVPNLRPARRTALAKSRARHRPLAGALQFAHREHSLAAGHAQAVFGDA